MSYLDAQTFLRRSGVPQDTVHLATCRHLKGKKSLPWSWAEGRPAAEVETAKENGLRFCRTCNPIAVLRAKQVTS